MSEVPPSKKPECTRPVPLGGCGVPAVTENDIASGEPIGERSAPLDPLSRIVRVSGRTPHQAVEYGAASSEV